jgi:hypothetical protein
MQTRDKHTEEAKRDIDLENIVGNLLIAEYQVDKLQTRLDDLVSGYRSYRSSTGDNKTSTHIFKHNNKWYKISLGIEKSVALVLKRMGKIDQQIFQGMKSEAKKSVLTPLQYVVKIHLSFFELWTIKLGFVVRSCITVLTLRSPCSSSSFYNIHDYCSYTNSPCYSRQDPYKIIITKSHFRAGIVAQRFNAFTCSTI